MSTLHKRLIKEFRGIQRHKNEEIEVIEPLDIEDLMNWIAIIKGPKDSPYEDGLFKLSITIPSQYPMAPPKFEFLTKICHPNIHFKTGEICLDILKNSWSPAWTLQTICTAISLLLVNPEPSSPLNCDAANLLRDNDILGYTSLVRMYTELYAMDHNKKSNQG
ncbi:PEROXIN-4-like protein [Neoconidiobolus thromboides FSU 785]|nr:PEROXIN-4-like protein [Neoconidiobolus thromboides FSU 785]